MPPRNPTRPLLTEAALAQRIAYEREKHGMTYEGLARRMTDAGCPINQSALYKIEKGEPRRRITVDELVALSVVFSVPVGELLLPLEAAHSRHLADLLIAWNNARATEADAFAALRAAKETVERARVALIEHVHEHPELESKLEEWMGAWAEIYYGAGLRDEASEYHLAKLLDDPKRLEAYFTKVRAEEDGRG